MKFLLPVGGIVDHRFGILTTPAHKGIPAGIIDGMSWACDNEAYTLGFNYDRIMRHLDQLSGYRSSCLFVVIPDVVGSADRTIDLYLKWRGRFSGWPTAFVAQDGQETRPFPGGFDVLFIGGSTGWKLSQAGFDCIDWAIENKKRVHVGRVNYYRRYAHFSSHEKSEGFTCDGTRTRFEGRDRAVEAWALYMGAPRQIRLPLPVGDRPGELFGL